MNREEITELIEKLEYTKEDIFRAAEIMASTKAYNVNYTASILSHVIPIPIIEEAIKRGYRPEMFKDRFRQLMQDNGLTIREAERLYGWSKSSIVRWRNGSVTPHPETLADIAEVFDVPVEYLVGGAYE